MCGGDLDGTEHSQLAIGRPSVNWARAAVLGRNTSEAAFGDLEFLKFKKAIPGYSPKLLIPYGAEACGKMGKKGLRF